MVEGQTGHWKSVHLAEVQHQKTWSKRVKDPVFFILSIYSSRFSCQWWTRSTCELGTRFIRASISTRRWWLCFLQFFLLLSYRLQHTLLSSESESGKVRNSVIASVLAIISLAHAFTVNFKLQQDPYNGLHADLDSNAHSHGDWWSSWCISTRST